MRFSAWQHAAEGVPRCVRSRTAEPAWSSGSSRERRCVSIVIASAFKKGRIFRCVESIGERTSYPSFELVVVANNLEGRDPPEIHAPPKRCRVLTYDGEFNYSAINNAGAAAAEGEYVLFLNDDTEVITPDWIERLVSEAQQPGVGIVGAKLLFPDGLVQLGGQLLIDNIHGATVSSVAVAADDPGYRGLLGVVRNMSSVCGACMLVDRDLFEKLGGFDEGIAVEYNDVDLCLRALERGQRVVFTPRAQLLHDERASRGAEVHPRDNSRFRQRWGQLIRAGDPYYNPNLGYDPDYEPEAQSPTPVAVLPMSEHRSWSERFVPEETLGGLTQAEHVSRYEWASGAVTGKDVLDAGCGVGYGSLILARAGATRVVGADLDAEAIDDARFRAGPEVEFVVADLESLPFPPESFDVAVCFETIEHVADRDRALDELKRVLRPSGVLIISSPNRGVYPPGNPHHVHEYEAAEFHAALAGRFRNVALRRQHAWLASLITDDAGLLARELEAPVEAAVHKLAAVPPGSELYTLAVATDGTLPDPAGVAVLSEVREVQERFEEVGSMLAIARHERASVQQEANAARQQLHALESQHDDLQSQLAAVLESKIWRATAPLRAVADRLRRKT